MANRNTLSVNKIEDFKTWLKTKGWQAQKTKGIYEVLRAVKQGRKYPLIIYCRDDTNNEKELVHCTVLDRDMRVVWAYLKEKKNVKDKR